jgi:hypothetical protein
VSNAALGRGGRLLLLALACLACACRGKERRLRDARKTDESVAASASLLAQARRDGKVSRAFARTTCDVLYQQLETARASVAGTPADRADPQLKDAAVRLDRGADAVASLSKALAEGVR